MSRARERQCDTGSDLAPEIDDFPKEELVPIVMPEKARRRRNLARAQRSPFRADLEQQDEEAAWNKNRPEGKQGPKVSVKRGGLAAPRWSTIAAQRQIGEQEADA